MVLREPSGLRRRRFCEEHIPAECASAREHTHVVERDMMPAVSEINASVGHASGASAKATTGAAIRCMFCCTEFLSRKRSESPVNPFLVRALHAVHVDMFKVQFE
eukprot:7385113-Prymnesium_polylepis.3